MTPIFQGFVNTPNKQNINNMLIVFTRTHIEVGIVIMTPKLIHFEEVTCWICALEMSGFPTKVLGESTQSQIMPVTVNIVYDTRMTFSSWLTCLLGHANSLYLVFDLYKRSCGGHFSKPSHHCLYLLKCKYSRLNF